MILYLYSIIDKQYDVLIHVDNYNSSSSHQYDDAAATIMQLQFKGVIVERIRQNVCSRS